MAKNSLFGRMVRGGGVSPLTPPRPIANLWKSAQLDSGAGDIASGRLASGAEVRVQAAAPVSLGRPATASSALLPLPPPRLEGRRRESPAPFAAISEAAMQPQSKKVEAQAPKPQVPVLTRMDARAVRSEDRTDRKQPVVAYDLQPENRRRRPASEPSTMDRLEQRPVLEAGPRPEVANVRADQPLAASTARRPESLEPVRPRELPRSEWAAASPREARSQQKNTIQIGRIEVQVVSPPAVVQRAAAQALPRERLARGYTLWSTW